MVTGGAGFIGYHTAKRLAQENHNVVVVDNFNKYYDPKLKESRAKELLKFKNITLIKADFSNYKSMDCIFKEHKFDKICHLGAQAGVRYSLEDPLAYIKSNVQGTTNLLELCKKYKIKHFIFASSSSVYGLSKEIPFRESQKVDNPVSLYAATKKSNEEIAFTYHHLYNINCIGLRFFTVYGEYGRPDMALFKFTKNILENKPIDVYNEGKMSRDFSYIGDVIEGVIAAINYSKGYEIFNLGNGKPVKLLDFIKIIEKQLNIKAKKNLMPMQPGDVYQTHADISKAKKLLKYNPKTKLEEGIKNFLDWYLKYYKIKTE